MPRPRFNKLDDERRDTIMEAAAKVFAAEGYHGASINQILQNAGLSKGVAYYYFEDKADLYATTIEFYLQRIEAGFDNRLNTLNIDNFWSLMLEMYSEPFLDNLDAPYRFQVLKTAAQIPKDDPIMERITPLMQKVFGWTAELVSRGQQLGLVRTDLPNDLLFGFISAIDAVADTYLLDCLDHITRDELMALQSQVVDAIRRILSP